VPTRFRRALSVAIPLASLILLLGATGASAAIRWAAPGGTAPADSGCPINDPCSLFDAASLQAPNTLLQAGDRILLEPGEYSDSAGDFGPGGTIDLPQDVTLLGVEARPHLVIAASSDEPAMFLQQGDVVSNLEIVSGGHFALVSFGGVVANVIARDQAEEGTSCLLGGGTIRDSVCLAAGDGGRAVAIESDIPLPLTQKLRNVTVVAGGAGSTGLAAVAVQGAQVGVDAEAVIAQGTDEDVEAFASGMGSDATIGLEASDFVSSEAMPLGGATAAVTAPGAGTNIIAQPLLAADGFHELPGSPTVDNGAVDADSGAADIDGQQRIIGTAADIGADEQGPPTETTLACLPDTVAAGDPVVCTATVEDIGNDNPSSPRGLVVLGSDHDGAFTPAPVCELEDIGAAKASCQLTYSSELSAIHTITALYVSEDGHDPSGDSAQVTISAPPPHRTTTSLSCAPTGLQLRQGSATCTATVSDTAAANPRTPSGLVKFASDGAGAFADGGACTLVPTDAGSAGCRLAYTPSAGGTHNLTAAYQGDPTHAPGQGSAQIQIGTAPDPAPSTRVKKMPRRKSTGLLASFAFGSDQPGSTFQCKLDKAPFRACSSPFKRKVKPGRHTFQVRAIGATGVSDPTPVVYHWTVLRNAGGR
jgi:hypothetical protein